MNACTIVAKNYLAHARVLARSFRDHHPDGRFTVLVLDDVDGVVDAADQPFDVLSPFDVGLPEFLLMAGTYDVLELSTAVKPWLLRTLLEGDGADHVVYLDPDIRIEASCASLVGLAREHGMVLTPHNVAAMPRDGKRPNEQDILIAGAYNLGFLALGDGEAAHEFLDWWGERLRTDCIVDPDRGFFVDQRWVDLAPGLVPSVHFLRDPGWNVAYWNLWTRDVQPGADGGHTVNGTPLRFFHFSGYDPRRPELLSKHQNRIDLADRPVVREICDAYGAALAAEGYDERIGLGYAYDRTPSGLLLDRTARRLYAEGIKAGALHAPLFEPEGEAAFLAYAQEHPGEDAHPGVTRYLAVLHRHRRDLQAAFPTLAGEPGAAYVAWAIRDAPGHQPESTALLPAAPPAVAAPGAPGPAAAPAEVDPLAPFGVNLVGYLSAELGVGEVGRQVIAALDRAAVPVHPIKQIAPASRQDHPFDATTEISSPFAVNLLCVNADQTPPFAAAAGPGFFAGRRTVGWWWWEVDDFPEVMRSAFAHVDEVWAGSTFVAEAIGAVSPVPVLRMPLPIAAPAGPAVSRAELGLPERAFLYLFSFDFNSIVARKNPHGLVEAFRRAYPEPGEDVALVVKSINGERHPEQLAALEALADGRPDVVVMDRYLPVGWKDALTRACDCYVSLHRSEGFGIGMAEAALLGKPVIATGYGGNVDFLAPAGGYLVRHRLVPIGPGNAPYPEDGRWAEPDLDHAAELLRRVREAPEEAAEVVARTREWLAEHHSAPAAGEAMARRLAQLAGGRPPRAAALEQIGREAHAAARRGPEPWPHARHAPQKYARAAVLRVGKPLLTQVREVAQRLARGLEQQGRVVQGELELNDARLRSARREEDRFRADVGHHLEGLQTFAERTDPVLRRADHLADAAAAVPFMSGDDLRVRDGELRFEGAAEGGYRAFEDLFRGTEAMISERQRRYLPVLRGHAPVLDAGCGRGELLDLLADDGIEAVGVDLDEELVAHCRAKGHERVEAGDAVAWLEAAEPGSIGAVASMQVVEHLPEAVLLRFIAAAHRALRPGGLLVMETVNPHSPHALKAFWVDLSHQHPVFPEVLLQLSRAAGFSSGRAFCPQGRGDWDADRLVQGEYAVVATR